MPSSHTKRVDEREVVERRRRVRGGDELVAPAGLREQDPRGGHEVVGDGAAAVRDAGHRVREVTVEAGEEAEAVLGGQIGAAVRCPDPGTGIERALPPNASRAS